MLPKFGTTVQPEIVDDIMKITGGFKPTENHMNKTMLVWETNGLKTTSWEFMTVERFNATYQFCPCDDMRCGLLYTM